LTVLLLVAFSLLAQEPARVSLRIAVQSQSAPVAGASIEVGGDAARTDAAGIATLSVPPGTLLIKVAKPGFAPGSASLVVEAGRPAAVDVELQKLETVEDDITVNATRTGVRLQDSPTRVEVLGIEEIDEKVLMTPGDIVMMLNEMGGLRVQATSPSLGAASVRIQGMRGRYTRFLADGLPLFGQQGGGLGLLQTPPMDLAQVEVIKGAASALYGAGALGGVVDLISRRPAKEPVHEFLLNRTTRGGSDASAFLASQLSREWGASLLAGGHFQQRNDIDGDGWADLAGYSRGVFKPRFFWDGSDGRSGFLTGGITLENRRGGTVPGAALAATGAPYEEALFTRRYEAGGSFQALLGRYVATARFAASTLHHDHRFGEVRERDRHDMLFGEASVRGAEGRHTWVAGAAIERDAYRPQDAPRFAYTYRTPGVFAQDDITLTPWLSVSASARVDVQNRYGTFFSPRASALLRWNGWTSRFSAGQGFFAPSPLTEETESAGLTRLTIPTPLVAERGRTASFDLTRAIGPASYTVTLFSSRVSHPLYVERDPRYRLISLPEPATNLGAEFLGTYRKAPFTATMSYTWVRPRERLGGKAIDAPLTPRHSFGITAMWEVENWKVGAECYYTGRQRLEENPYRDASEPYVLFGLLGERRLGPLRLFVNVENLGNVRQSKWDSLLRPARGADGRWTVDAWAPLDGRVLNGGVRFRF
jgi:outer membrane receptor for ferrienterochelin and colicins